MRTRFAPSPTGFLHIGGLRTALFAWLVAKKKGGTFFLRIEDTDKSREVAGAVRNIVSTLEWAGLLPDEGVMCDANGELCERGMYGPYLQSQRLDTYKRYADELLLAGHAYRCFCTSQRLQDMRADQERRRQAPMYDRTCLALSRDECKRKMEAGEASVIRMKVPRNDTVTVVDQIYGELTFKGRTIDDQVLVKSDGFPTYHLAHVIDDHLMKTDMIIRGEEWISSLPKHVLLFRMFGWTVPLYAHMPLLLNTDRSKLSKRQNDVSAESYQTKGYLPEALINFLALLGWNPGTTQEIFTREELLEAFSLERVHKAGAVFDLQKLDWLQGQWMRKIPQEEFARRVLPLVASRYPKAAHDSHFHAKAALIQERITFFHEAAEMMGYFYEAPQASVELVAHPKQKVTEEMLTEIVPFLKRTLDSIDTATWTRDNIASVVLAAIERTSYKRGQVLWPLRAILTGRDYSPGAFEVAEQLTKEETLRRLDAFSLSQK